MNSISGFNSYLGTQITDYKGLKGKASSYLNDKSQNEVKYKNTAMSDQTMREKIRNLSRSDDDDSYKNQLKTGMESILNSSQSYLDSLRENRLKTKATNRKVSAVKYNFKNLSSKIIRSKTSYSAKQVVRQARQEVQKLKIAKGKADSSQAEEFDAAIVHAKAMERVAKKKARNLELEEMAEANGGKLSDDIKAQDKLNERQDSQNEEKVDDTDDELKEEDSDKLYDEAYEDIAQYEDLAQYEDFAQYEDLVAEDLMTQYENLSSLDISGLSDMTDISDLLSGFESDIFDEMQEEMQSMMEEMGLDDMSETFKAYDKDIEPKDLKEMKIKHRNKENKDLVKADSDYLKAVFDRLAKMSDGKSVSGTIGQTASLASAGSGPHLSASMVQSAVSSYQADTSASLSQTSINITT